MQSHNKAKFERLQILSFILDNDYFGMEIRYIQEVLEFRKVTAVPRTPDYMLGVVNLRGQVLPVVDLRRYFDMAVSEPSVDSCIIIVEITIDGEKTALGLLADRVKEVLELHSDDITPPPKLGNKIDTEYIFGMARHSDQFIILLRLQRIFSEAELHEVIELTEDEQSVPSAGQPIDEQ